MSRTSPDDEAERHQIREQLERPEVLQRLLDDAERAIEADRSVEEGGVTGRDWALVVAFAVLLPAILYFVSVSSQPYVVP
jgi:hypothetical protein